MQNDAWDDVLVGKYFSTVIRDQYHDFPLRGWLAVFRVYRPVIGFVYIDFHPAHIYHRLNCKYHARNHQHFFPALAVIADPWVFVKFQADAVAADFTDNGIPVCKGMVVDGLSHIAHGRTAFRPS